MTESCDTSELFQDLLSDFRSSLNNATSPRTTELQNSLAVKVAIIGFSQFSSASDWSQQHFEFIATRLEGELSPAELDWYEECAESISVFACFALGALLGKFQQGEIDEAGFKLGDAHLAGFLSLHNEEICARFCA